MSVNRRTDDKCYHMETVIQHKTPQDFINKTFNILEKRELEDNLLISFCEGIPNKEEENIRLQFLSKKDNIGEIVCSMKTISKALIGGTSIVLMLVLHFLQKSISK